MIVIHKTYSLNELIILCDIFKFDIPDYYDYYKKDLKYLMEQYINDNKKVKLQNEFFNFKNIIQLKRYLEKPNTKYKLTIEEKKYINYIAKEIINFCYNDFDILKLRFFYLHGKQIAKYGDLKNVRKAINILNTFPQIEEKIVIENSIFFLYNLKYKKHLHNKFHNKFKLNHNTKIISFN